MKFIKDKEKSILFAALIREKRFIKEHEDLKDLIPVVDKLEHYFINDKLFKNIYNKAINDVVNSFIEIANYKCWSGKFEIYDTDFNRFIEQLKEK